MNDVRTFDVSMRDKLKRNVEENVFFRVFACCGLWYVRTETLCERKHKQRNTFRRTRNKFPIKFI